jgi:periplasmic protein TonB
MKSIGLVFFILGFLDSFCYGQQNDTMIYNNPDVLPTFKYDNCSDLKGAVKKYFTDNYKMPDILIGSEYAGNIYVEFVIEKDSSISNVKLIRGIDEPLDKSVIEIIKAMPKWSPGINKERVVRTRFILPISIHWLYGKIEE